MLRYIAGYKFVDGGVHAQVLDFPAVITCATDLPEARGWHRQSLGIDNAIESTFFERLSVCIAQEVNLFATVLASCAAHTVTCPN